MAQGVGGGPKPVGLEVLAKRGTLRGDRLAAQDAREEAQEALEAPKYLVPARDYVGIAAAYAADVVAGRVVACRWTRLACERQQRDLARKGWRYVWDQQQAIDACRFIESCPHVEGRWSSPLIVLEPWQIFILTALFGWRHRDDPARRRFTTLYLEVGRKSAKSTLAAAIALYHVLREGEPGAQVILGATTGSQARIVFEIMQKMILRSRWLRRHGLEKYANAIVAPDGTAKPINARASSQDGLNPSCIVLDESHAQDFELHDVLKSAQGARLNPLMVCPTTAGYDLLSVGYALRTQLTKVLDQVFEADHLLGVIYTLDADDDWRDAAVWQKACPMLGISPTIDYVTNYAQDAQQARELEGEFRVKICNQWAASAATWLSMAAWDLCADPTLRLEQFTGDPCWLGADLAQIDDLAAVALAFRRGDDVIGFVRSYLPEGVVEQRARTVPAYRQWLKDGLLVPTSGNMIDYARIEADIRAFCKQFQVRAIVFDQFGSVQIAGNLVASNLPAIIQPKNARTFTPPAREFEARVTHHRFKHDGNSLLKWAASNAVVSRRIDDSLLPKKESAESANKIDPIDALLQAIGAMISGTGRVTKEPQLLVLGGPAR